MKTFQNTLCCPAEGVREVHSCYSSDRTLLSGYILFFLLLVLSGLRFFLTLDHSVQGHKLNMYFFLLKVR